MKFKNITTTISNERIKTLLQVYKKPQNKDNMLKITHLNIINVIYVEIFKKTKV